MGHFSHFLNGVELLGLHVLSLVDSRKGPGAYFVNQLIVLDNHLNIIMEN